MGGLLGPETGRSWRLLTASRSRVAAMIVAGLMTAAVVGTLTRWLYAPLAGWDVAAMIFSAWAWGRSAPSTRPEPPRTQAGKTPAGA